MCEALNLYSFEVRMPPSFWSKGHSWVRVKGGLFCGKCQKPQEPGKLLTPCIADTVFLLLPKNKKK